MGLFEAKKRFELSILNLPGIKDEIQSSECHRQWVEEILKSGLNKRDAKWTIYSKK